MNKNNELAFAAALLNKAEKISVLTGSGISAESGIPTFRGKEGLWKQFRAEDLATPQAFSQNPQTVWEWYDWRRRIIASKAPNAGHRVLADWGKKFPVFTLITQNIDGLHQKAGSRDVIELHGNIWKLRCVSEETVTENHDSPLKEIPPRCFKCGALLRPHVVWFGEPLDMPLLQKASSLASESDVTLVIGTSAAVYPAAAIPFSAKEAGTKLVEINPESTPLTQYADLSLRGKAGKILPEIDYMLKHMSSPDQEPPQ